MCYTKTISITVLRFYDFVRLSIVISFQIMFSYSIHNQICVGVQICFLNCKIYVRTGFLDSENMGKGTKTDFLSQILRTLWGIEYLVHLALTAILFFADTTEKLLKGAGGCGVVE